eukprot:2449283-Prymnesium_polylepis.1
MMTSLMRSPLFAAMCQPEGTYVHTQVFEDLADTVRNGRKQFTKVMVACTASSYDDENDPGTVRRDIFFNAVDHLMTTGQSWSVYIPQRMSVVNTIQVEIFDAGIVPPPALREVFSAFIKINYEMVKRTIDERGDAEDVAIQTFLEHGTEFGTTGLSLIQSLVQQSTTDAVSRG